MDSKVIRWQKEALEKLDDVYEQLDEIYSTRSECGCVGSELLPMKNRIGECRVLVQVSLEELGGSD
jgi:hypothetical protein